MTYKEYRNLKQKEINELPLLFAFSGEQVGKILEEKNCTAEDLFSVPAINGCLVHKDDVEEVRTYFSKKSDLKERLKDKEFFKEALEYELRNHEFGYTWDFTDTFEVLDIDMDFINKNGFKEILEEIVKKF